MGLKITIDTASLDQFAARLAALGDGRGQRALADALNKTGDKGRTQIKRALAAQSGIAYGQIDKTMQTHRASPEHLAYELVQPGSETPLSLFGARQTAVGVSAAPWGRRLTFGHTFIVKAYGWGVFERVGWQKNHGAPGGSRWPIRQLWGPNLARELIRTGSPTVAAFEKMPLELQPQIEAQIKRYAM